MNKYELKLEYFNWICEIISANRYTSVRSYSKLLHYLYRIEFVYIIDMDGNRAEDGTDLRYRFGKEAGYDDSIIKIYLDESNPCSILEMMVALSIRMEEHIMEDSDAGDRTGQWFWSMIDSLGLLSMKNSAFDRPYVERVVDRFIKREYAPNGKGSLFYITPCSSDMRNTEIWYQMCAYLNTIVDA